MKTRIISGFALIPLIALVFLGGWWLAALCLVVALIGVKEFFDGCGAMDVHPSLPLAYGLILLLYVANGFWPNQHTLLLGWVALSVILCSLVMFDIERRTPIDAAMTLIGLVYIAFFTFHLVLIDQTGEFSIMKWMAVITACATDTFAYFAGVFLGRHKLCPTLSPKKTIEGAIGGIIGSVLCSAIFAHFLCCEYFWSCVIIGLVASPVSMCGDLTASAYKRKMGIKDYGNLIPGHGGVMDRFDSILFTAPFVYYYIVIVMQHFGLLF